jgi:hypothetical protein
MKLSNQSKTFPSRVQQLRSEASALIDAKTEELRREAPGVPNEALKVTLLAPYSNDVIDAAIAILANEMKGS